MASLEDQQALLLYRVGPVLCCSPSYTVLSIIQPVPLTHPPGSDSARPGIFRHSGHVVKTEDLRVRFGVAEADRRPGRMVIAEVDSGRTAFWVDDIIDVISMPSQGWGQLPPHLPKGIFSRTLLLNEKIYLYADFDALQKLQGHGLLKTYIEQLLQEKHPTSAPAIATKTATTSVSASSKATDTTTATTTKTTSDKTTTEKSATANIKPAEQHQTNTETNVKKDDVVTTKPASLATAKVTSSPAAKPVPRSTVTPHHASNIESKTRSTAAKKRANTPGTKATPEKPAVHHEKKTFVQETPAVTQTSGGFSWSALVIILLLIMGSGVGIYYYLQDHTEPTPTTYEPSTTIGAYTTKSTEPVDTFIAPPPVIATAPTIKPEEETKPVTQAEASSATDSTSENISSDYQAKIEKNNEGITIVIKAPKEETVLKETLAENSTEAETKIAPLEKPLEEKVVTPKPPQREEILHIVVKGDTLWHIAKRYVNNPFRYPELARLSNIKNPDLIYPGDRVRIIREFN